MSKRDNFFEVLYDKFSFSKNISFEWSLRIYSDSIQERDKVICWVNNKDNKAHQELYILQDILKEYDYLSKIPFENVINAGIGFSHDETNSFYIHYLEGEDKITRYLAFSNDKILEYEFYYYPYTTNGDLPSSFVVENLKGVYNRLIKNPIITNMSGFWIRKDENIVDQLSLTYPYQPNLNTFLNDIYLFCSAKYELIEYKNEHLRHIAFNVSSTPSLTVYFSSSLDKFPKNFKSMRSDVRNTAKKQNELITDRLFNGVRFEQVKKNDYLDDFYSTNDIGLWKNVLGKNMFYHFGLFSSEDDLNDIWSDTPFFRAMTDITRHIEDGSSVYDLGCGWGAISKYLKMEKNCDTVSITISKTQYKYCNDIGIKCRHGDMEHTLPPGYFDNLLLIESLEHVVDKYAFLRQLRNFGTKLIIRTSTQETNANNIVFGDSMVMVSLDNLKGLLKETGWNIVYMENKRAESMRSIDIWNARMENIPRQDDFHFEVWREYCKKILYYKEKWAKAHPLIDIVAE